MVGQVTNTIGVLPVREKGGEQNGIILINLIEKTEKRNQIINFFKEL
jgi:hypothetical protein